MHKSKISMVRFDDYLQERLKDEEFRLEYEALEVGESITNAIEEMRTKRGMTAEERARTSGLTTAEIRALEACDNNPTLKMLQKLAWGLGCKLHIELEAM